MLIMLLVVLVLSLSFFAASWLGRKLHKQSTYTCLMCETGEFDDPRAICEACTSEINEGIEHACFRCQRDSEDCEC